jgi:hypothetical protein
MSFTRVIIPALAKHLFECRSDSLPLIVIAFSLSHWVVSRDFRQSFEASLNEFKSRKHRFHCHVNVHTKQIYLALNHTRY